MSAQILPLDPNLRSNTTIEFQSALRSKIVGQAEGVQALVDLYQVFCAGLELAGAAGGEPPSFGPDGLGQDAHRGSRGGDSFWRCSRSH